MDRVSAKGCVVPGLHDACINQIGCEVTNRPASTHRNICTYILSGTAATAVILRVLYGRFFNRDPEAIVRVSIENLMARLVCKRIDCR